MINAKPKWLLFCLNVFLGVVALCGTAIGQYKTVKFSSLTVNDGLSQSNVKYILKDRQGFMWFCTDDGLNRYDGYNFVVYRHDAKNKQSIAASNVTVAFEDRAGNIWVG